MNCTPAEFRRALRQAFGEAAVEDETGVLLSDGEVQLHFALRDGAPRKIAALQLAVLDVEIAVRRGEAAAVEELLARVDRATLRGGG